MKEYHSQYVKKGKERKERKEKKEEKKTEKQSFSKKVLGGFSKNRSFGKRSPPNTNESIFAQAKMPFGGYCEAIYIRSNNNNSSKKQSTKEQPITTIRIPPKSNQQKANKIPTKRTIKRITNKRATKKQPTKQQFKKQPTKQQPKTTIQNNNSNKK